MHNVSQVNFLVIDEADAFLDKNSTLFPSTANLLNKLLPDNVQYGFFSATFKNSIIEFIKKKRPNIITIRLNRKQQNVQTVGHWYTKVDSENEAFCAIYDLVTKVSKGQTFVFARSNKLIEAISEFLIGKSVSCKVFSFNLSPQERDKTLDEFRNEEFKVLISSDVLARGIDIPNAYLVINYQTPVQFVPLPKNRFVYQDQDQSKNEKKVLPDCDTYFHRAGRAAHFGRSSICFTIATDDRDEQNLKMFCSSINLNIPLNMIAKDKLASLPKIIDTNNAQEEEEQPNPEGK